MCDRRRPIVSDEKDAFRAEKWAGFILGLAALYNVAWGAAVVLAPGATLRAAGIGGASPVELWQCIGMLVGVYGVAYGIASADPRRHRAIVLVGFLGKLLGPLGTLAALRRGSLPASFLLVNLTNDLIWLPLFAWILWRLRSDGATSAFRGSGSLYERLMGADFERLGPRLRAFHAARAPIEVRGTFSVERGRSPLARWLADRAGFPRERAEVPVHLRVTQREGVETWARSFDRDTMTSRQWQSGDRLAERFGPITLFLAARADGASLEIVDVRALMLGLPLPPPLSPRVMARGTDEESGVRLSVRLALPLVGLLVQYGGRVQIVETGAGTSGSRAAAAGVLSS
jgi:hypothetical protein